MSNENDRPPGPPLPTGAWILAEVMAALLAVVIAGCFIALTVAQAGKANQELLALLALVTGFYLGRLRSLK